MHSTSRTSTGVWIHTPIDLEELKFNGFTKKFFFFTKTVDTSQIMLDLTHNVRHILPKCNPYTIQVRTGWLVPPSPPILILIKPLLTMTTITIQLMGHKLGGRGSSIQIFPSPLLLGLAWPQMGPADGFATYCAARASKIILLWTTPEPICFYYNTYELEHMRILG